jgi:hypothetical protein
LGWDEGITSFFAMVNRFSEQYSWGDRGLSTR